MAKIPTPRSWNQIVGDMVDAFLSRFGLKSLKVGSPVLSIIEAAAQSDLRSSQDIFDLLNAQALDRAEGVALDRIGLDEDMTRLTESAASGAVVITDTSFQKISSKVYQGLPAPIIGSDILYVTDASAFPAAGRVFIGRGTSNYEGPLAYSAKANNGTYWTLTLTDNTRRFHNLGETVIVGQGGTRTISAGTSVQTPQGNTTDAVKFNTLFNSTIPDGEVQITGIQVLAAVPGVSSNVAASAISSFTAPPFAGATVTNPLPYTNGQGAEDDTTFRERIKDVRQSRAKGTALAITTNVQGIVATDENKRLTSSAVVVRQGFPTTLFIDDGTGYEESAEGTAVETLVDLAFGGEQYFQVSAERPVAKAYVVSSNTAPFVLAGGDRLAVRIGGATYEHTFDPTAFRSVGNATAYEVASTINANSALGFSASTAEAGSRVRLFAKDDINEDLEVVEPVSGVDANAAMLFATGRVDTMRLYKNDRLLNKDGKSAVVQSKPPSVWGTLTTGMTLIIAIDGTAAQTYTIADQDFIDAGTGYTSVGRNSLGAWAAVLNFKIPGITAVEANGLLEVTSNVGNSSRAKIAISGGTLVTPAQMFAAQTVSGADSDYTLDRNTGQIRLEAALAAGDALSVGTANTRAFVESAALPTTTIAAPGAKLWFGIDGGATLIGTGLSSATILNTTVSRVTYWGNRLRITASSSAFTNVRAGDWMIAYDANLNTAMQGTWRVTQATSTYVEIERQAMLAGRRNFQAVVLNDGRTLVIGGEVVNGSNGACTQTCEIFDPATNTWSPTGPMATARRFHAAILIASSGKVLVVGGQNTSAAGSSNAEKDAQYLTSCEIYDPVAGTWSPAASLPGGAQRARMFATLLTSPAERPTVAGGVFSVAGINFQQSTCYQYDPVGNTWTAKASMITGRSNGIAAPILAATKMLTAGGMIGSSATSSVNNAEIYDPTLDTWTAAPAMAAARRSFTVTLLASGKVLVTGGAVNGGTTGQNTAEVYDPSGGGSWTNTTGNMSVTRTAHAAAKMGNDQVMVGFGTDGTTAQLSAEVYNPSTGLFTATSAVQTAYDRVSGQMVAASGDALMIGGSENASSERYNTGTTLWTAPNESAVQANFSLASAGLVFVRSGSTIQQVNINAGTSYTARNFVDSLNTQLSGAAAKTFRTSKIRVNTRTYAIDGDIGLLAANVEGAKLLIPTGAAVENLSTHLASVQSGNTQAGTPEFTLPYIYWAESATTFRAYSLSQSVKANSMIVGLRSYDDLYNSATPLYRQGQNSLGYVSALQEFSNYLTKEQTLITRQAAREWISRDRFYAASPFAIGPSDDITVVVDGDTTSKRFTVPLHRTLATVGNTYASQNTFKDADNGGASMAIAFGLGYDFNDFALYMQSRVKTFPSDSTKTILWRYTRPGPDGDKARLRFEYPTDASQSLVVSTSATTSKTTDISIRLPSAALKTGYGVRNATKIGLAAASGPGGLEILSYILGYSVSSATRTQRINFQGQTVNYTPGEVITGALSGFSATIVSIPVDAGATGTLIISGSTGAFNANEALNGSGGGSANSNGSQYYQVDLTLTLPTIGGGALADITNHGFNVADTIYLNSVNANFSAGLKTITAVTPTTISYTGGETTAITQANIGTVSFDPSGEAAWTGAAPTPVAIADLMRVEMTSNLPVEYEGFTMRVSYYGAQVLQGYAENFVGSLSGTPTWATIADSASLKIFGLNPSSGTATAIAAKVKGFADAEDSTCPVTAVITGDGTGVVDKASFETDLIANSWESLSDGVNYVKSTASPGTLAGDYQLTFKNGINANLVSSADWANEKVLLVPLSTKNLVDWFNTLTVTGISTVASIEAADQAQRLQVTSLTPGSTGSVQVQGGTANEGGASVSGAAALVTDPDSTSYSVVTCQKADSQGFFAGMWMQVQNAQSMPKTVFFDVTTLLTWTTNGVMTFDSAPGTPLWRYAGSTTPFLSKTWQIEKQGNFVCFSFDGQYPGSSIPNFAGLQEGNWVRITTAVTPTANAVPISSVNKGIYRVVRVEVGDNNLKGVAFWIENPNMVEERVEADIAFYTFDSVMPGDKLSISTDLWNSNNKGVWTVESVGDVPNSGLEADQFTNSNAGKNTMKVVVSSRAPIAVNTPGALGTVQYRLVQMSEAQPSKLIKRIRCISPNQTDGTYVDIKFETSPGYILVNSTAGSIVAPLDKLAFGADLAQGTDGYSHNIGLIAEANRVAYGDPRDPATYPGVVAAGAKLNINGPLVKRISVALNLRVRSGISTTDVAARVRSAVASVVNQAGIGDSIAISDLLTAAGKVNGVLAVSMVSPTFNSENDLISVQPYEKPLILSLEQDVLVSFTGE